VSDPPLRQTLATSKRAFEDAVTVHLELLVVMVLYPYELACFPITLNVGEIRI
jgi:hypothetical protein